MTLTYGDITDGAQLRGDPIIVAALNYPSNILSQVGLHLKEGPVAVGPECDWSKHWLKFGVIGGMQ